ncbi:hypothetical protein [Vagococcus luciliae]|uniref:DNA translocase FtsK 4TM region domain-containing protein n=1 Tax=Vagococcus luciliae TaxID=2920380 RepID=A0ABY5NXK1_9ENTE|nr:hypothetical protein [Vagococcus luciliae]UUV98307.1 hypothetical protein G314FT_04230 [Vagococcus luciliae]
MNKRLASFYVTMAIIGIITAVPVLGGMIDVFKVLTILLLSFSIYVLAKQPKKVKKSGAILMIISCTLSLIGGLIVLGSVGNLSMIKGDSAYKTGAVLGSFIGGSIVSYIFRLPAWILKILAIIFSFQASNQLKAIDLQKKKSKHKKKSKKKNR